MLINVFIKNKLTQNWFENTAQDLEGVHEFNFHNSIFSLSNELSLKNSQSISIIDLEFENYHHFTNDVVKANQFSKFIGVGVEKTCPNLIEKLRNHIGGYISVNDNSYILAQAITALNNDSVFLNQDNINLLVDIIKTEGTANNKDYNIHKRASRKKTGGTNVEIEKLTEKELVVCKLLTQGYSYKEIADIVGLTSYAINQKAKSIYKKLSVRSRSELSFKILY